jgi:phosphoribosylformylglycinamidine cyclo-ligase
MGLKVTDREESLSQTIGEALLVPTRIYVRPILSLLGDFHIHGIAHITGGGFTDNIPRIIPSGCKAVVRRNTWPVPPIFKVIQDGGKISEGEMLRTFNNGIGMILAVPPQEAKDIILHLEGLNEKAYPVGEIIRAKAQERAIQFE